MTTASELNQLSSEIIAASIEVHKELGCGLLERVYEAALHYELTTMGIQCIRQQPVPVRYKGVFLDEEGYKMDLLVENCIIFEFKTVPQLLPIHSSQLLTYLRLNQKNLGLLINFNETLLRDGIGLVVNNFPKE